MTFKFDHDPFSLQTTPLPDHDLCGDLVTEAAFEGEQVTLNSSPVAYNPDSREFTVYSFSSADEGMREVTLTSYLVDYPTTTVSASFMIDFTRISAEL